MSLWLNAQSGKGVNPQRFPSCMNLLRSSPPTRLTLPSARRVNVGSSAKVHCLLVGKAVAVLCDPKSQRCASEYEIAAPRVGFRTIDKCDARHLL